MTLRAFHQLGTAPPINLCQNILFATGYYIYSGIDIGDLTKAKNLVNLMLNELFSLDNMY